MHNTKLRSGGALAAVLALGVGTLIAPTALAAPAPVVLNDPLTLDNGHIDAFNLVLNEDDSPRLTLKEDVTGSHVMHEPESVELFVKPDALTQVPADYLPGLPEQIYHLPLTQDHNLIWPGWDTQAITSAFPNADTGINVSNIDGPGEVFLWTQNWMGQPESLLEGKGYTLPGVISQPYPAHTHAAWGFTEVGTYKFTVQADVTGSNGNTGSTQVSTYTIVVAERTKLTPEAPVQEGNTVTIPEQEWVTYTDSEGSVLAPGAHELAADLTVNASAALGFEVTDGVGTSWSFSYSEPISTTLNITGLADEYTVGDEVSLTAVQDPATGLDHYHWFIKRSGDEDYQIIADTKGNKATFTVTEADNGAEVIARLYGDGHAVVAESAPAILNVVAAPIDPTDPTDPTPLEDDNRNVFFADNWAETIARTGMKIAAADQILSGDFNNDGVDTLALRTGNEYTLLATNRTDGESVSVTLPVNGISVVGDFDGNGFADIAVRVENSNRFEIFSNVDGVIDTTADITLTYGKPEDVPLAGDWDGDGTDTLSVQRGATFYLKNTLEGGLADKHVVYGRAGDQALVGNFDGTAGDSIAVVRDAVVYVRNGLGGGWADVQFNFEHDADARVVGDWFGKGVDTLAGYKG